MSFVLDASALLALIWSESGGEKVADIVDQSKISAVNLAEVCSKLSDRGVTGNAVHALLAGVPIHVEAFDQAQAIACGDLRHKTRRLGLSLGDRACLVLAIAEGASAVTADRSWKGLDLDISVQTIR
jgi:ribonuclease VapC